MHDRMMKERAILEALRRLPLHPGARGLADDAAVLELGSDTLVITHDMLLEGVHYLPGTHPADIAWKLVATNISDLAAKGAEPVGVLLGHQIGHADEAFFHGLAEALAHYRAPLLGGDTVAREGLRAHGLTAIGRATHTPVPARAGAQAGDRLWLVGELGGAMLGFEALRDARPPAAVDLGPYLRPVARLAEGIALAPLAHALMDVSDGLLLDAFRMAEASGQTLSLDSQAVPVADRARARACLTWGEDYALLAALPAGRRPPFPASLIGSVEPRGLAPLLLDGAPLASPEGLGYSH